jgi:hypothetical protein
MNNFKIKIILTNLFKDIKIKFSTFRKNINYYNKINYHKKIILIKNIQIPINKKAQIMLSVKMIHLYKISSLKVLRVKLS